jgi:aspartyl-tRNA(Asn)/glutamyl-tRNA(Gln) amidotransferase subunit A
MTQDLHFLTIAEAAHLIASRQLSPVDYTEAMLTRIAGIDPQLDAFLLVTQEQARAAARLAETEIAAGHYRGPLHGVPFALKDIIDTAGIRTTGHSKIAQHRVPDIDAEVTRRLYAAGGILLGKLATHEFAHGGPSFDLPWPPARNPWNPEHFTGSSSSGSGAAVAAGLVPAALGSDTGGSIRIPAGLCGVAGIKPTFGLVSCKGVIPNSFNFDHCGPLAWTAEDCAILLGAIAGPVGGVASTDYRAGIDGGIAGLRVGVIRHFWEEDVPAHPDLARAMDNAIAVLQSLGAVCTNVRVRPLHTYHDVKTIIAETEIFAVHQSDLQARAQDFGADFLGRTLGACLFNAADYLQAQRERSTMLDEFDDLYARFDLLVTVGNGPAARLDALAGQGYVNKWQKPNAYNIFSVSGGPTVSTCIGFSQDGLPLSMQISGHPFADAMVLRAGHAYEQATPWRQRRPTLAMHAPQVPVFPKPAVIETSADDAMRERVHVFAERAGLSLTKTQLDQLTAQAPFIIAMAQRMQHARSYGDEPAAIFDPRNR